jgi:hypothetical protein
LSFNIGYGSTLLFLLIQLGEYFPRVAERIDACRYAAIDRDVHAYLANFLAGGSVCQRAPDMGFEFVRRMARERPSRHIIPAIFRPQILHRVFEVVGRGDRLVHEFVANARLCGFSGLDGRWPFP